MGPPDILSLLSPLPEGTITAAKGHSMPLPRPAPGTGKWWALGVAGCAAGVAVAVWLGLSMSVGKVTWTDTGFQVLDDRTVEVEFDVHRPDGQAVTCVVRALDKGFGTVGTAEVAIPASGERSVHRKVTVRTTTRAVTGLVRSCAPA
jgi:Domain of unknown function (DUF4307)